MINDETLLLYFYDDGLTSEERRRIESEIASNEVLAARYAALREQLEDLRETDPTPVPEHLLHRWHASIDEAARTEAAKQERSKPSFHFMSFAWGGAVAAALAVAVGLYVTRDGEVPTTTVAPMATTVAPTAATVPAAFTRGLQVHLRDSQDELARLPVSATADRTGLLLAIVEQNRAFERSADANNAPDVARLLRAFEPILMRLASDDIAPEDAEALRAQLTFELNVMLTKLNRKPSDDEKTI